jgi:hypothetical protein
LAIRFGSSSEVDAGCAAISDLFAPQPIGWPWLGAKKRSHILGQTGGRTVIIPSGNRCLPKSDSYNSLL